MLRQDDNERLVRVGPGTPAGALFRRYWQPAALAYELPARW
jgi:phthalate 4,5-dioxygenase oxygenase subunit